MLTVFAHVAGWWILTGILRDVLITATRDWRLYKNKYGPKRALIHWYIDSVARAGWVTLGMYLVQR